MHVAVTTHRLSLGAAEYDLELHQPDAAQAGFLIVPALGVGARSYRRLAERLAASGAACALFDPRGVGSSSLRAGRGVDWGYLDLVDGELRQVYQRLRERLAPSAPLCLVGHSLGGQLSLLHQARHADQPAARICLVASGTPWQRAYPASSRWAVRLLAALARWSAQRLGYFPGDRLRFGGRQAAQLMREWAGFVSSGRIQPLAAEPWNATGALAALQRPLSLLLMAGDVYVPERSARALAELTAGAVSAATIDRLPDGSRPGHFGWMRQPDAVAAWLLHEAIGGERGLPTAVERHHRMA